MRFALPIGRWLFFLCALLLALAALVPLRLALGWLQLDAAGLSAREADGSIWLGALREARVAGAPVGDLGAALDPLPLIAGRARVRLAPLERRDGTPSLAGSLSVSRHSFAVEDLTATLPVARGFAALPLASLGLDGVTARFEEGLCTRGEGLVNAQASGDVAGIALARGLSGNVRCDAGALLLPLISQGGDESLMLWLSADGGFRAELTIRPSDPAARAHLAAAGFAPVGDRLRIAIRGTM